MGTGAVCARSSRCTYPGAVFGFTEWGMIMFGVSKSMATAAARLFGKRPNVLVVSDGGHIHNYGAGVVAGDGHTGGESVMLSRHAADEFMALIAGGGATVSVSVDTVTVSTAYGSAVLEGDAGAALHLTGGHTITVTPSKSEWSAVYASTSADDTVPILNAAALVPNGGGVSLVSTDRYRLTAVDVDGHGAIDAPVIVPRALVMVAKSQPARARVSLTAGVREDGRAYAAVAGDGFTAWSDTMEGDYPKVLSLFPNDAPARYTVVDAKRAAAAVKDIGKRVERNCPVRVAVTDSGVSVAESADEKFVATIPAIVDDAPDFTTGFNPKFLADILTNGGKGSVIVRQGENARKPVVFEYSDEPRVRALLMPIIRF